MATDTYIDDDTRAAPRKFNPAYSIVNRLGGARVAAEICGVNVTSVYRWMWPSDPKDGEAIGSGGVIPARHQLAIMEWSWRNGRPVEALDFFEKPSQVE